MKPKTLPLLWAFALGTVVMPALRAQGPTIPPTISSLSPAGLERGTTSAFKVDGRNLSGATDVIFDAPGMTGKVTGTTDIPEQITGPRAGQDLGAQVPLGKKQTAQLEITVAPDAWPGIHHFRLKTPLGTTNLVAFAVGTLPEVTRPQNAMGDSAAASTEVTLPVTLVGKIARPGDKDTYQFAGKAGEEVVFAVQAAPLGSMLKSMITLSDASGMVLATAGKHENRADVALTYRLPEDGNYTLSVTDRDREGGMDYFYRVDAGPLPYVSSVFPLGVRAGQPAEIAVSGANLGGIHQVKVDPPQSASGWTTMPLALNAGGVRPINESRLVVGNEPEILEQEPNDSVDHAQAVSLPVTINGHIFSSAKADGAADEDYFRFHARKGQQLDIEVAAARLGSPLDSVIEVLDAQGNPIPRATIRCLNQTVTTLSDKDSRTTGIRLVSTSDLHDGDYLMIGDELNKIDVIPDQPDFDTIMTSINNERLAYLGTSPDVHAVNTPVYKAEILPPDAQFPSNGLPVFHLTWRNDDGGPGYGADSKLDFEAPADGDYILHLKDVRGMEGPDFAYRLTIRPATPDFELRAEPENPNIPRGASTLVTVSLVALHNYHGPIQVEVKGLPAGVTATPATIPPGQESTVIVLTASADASPGAPPAPIQFIGHGEAGGHELIRIANARGKIEPPPLQLASVTPAPDVLVTTNTKQIALEPGKDATVTLHIDRQNGFKGRVPCFVQNLPPGVRVVNVGLNGVLVTEEQSSRTFTLHAEDWAQPIRQPIYVVALVESNSSTMHPSDAMLLNVAAPAQTASARNGAAADAEHPSGTSGVPVQ